MYTPDRRKRGLHVDGAPFEVHPGVLVVDLAPQKLHEGGILDLDLRVGPSLPVVRFPNNTAEDVGDVLPLLLL